MALFRVWWILALVAAVHVPQSAVWTSEKQCVASVESAPAGWQYDGVIVSQILEDGVRGLRAESGRTYYIAFAGSNFIRAGTLTGDWYAVLYGYIETVGLSNIHYRVNELRVHNTQVNAQIRVRLPWRVTFQYPDIIPLRWLDDETLLVPFGSFEDALTWRLVKPFDADAAENATQTVLGDYLPLSPDLAYGFAPVADGWGLFDLRTDTLQRTLPATTQLLGWSPSAATFATYDPTTRTLQLHTIDAETPQSVFQLTEDQRLWNFRWSPDDRHFAFSTYDPYNNENWLYVGDAQTRTITETCIQLINQHNGDDEAGIAWSPDGALLALLTSSDATSRASLQIYELHTGNRYAIGGYAGGLIGWGR